jgi:hypothetical protein
MWIFIGMNTKNSWIRPDDKLLKGEPTAIDELGKIENNLRGYYVYAL